MGMATERMAGTARQKRWINMAQHSRNQKISPQRRGGGPDSWERTLPACNSNPMATTCTPEACGPRKTREKILSKRPRICALVVQMHAEQKSACICVHRRFHFEQALSSTNVHFDLESGTDMATRKPTHSSFL